MGKLVRRFKYDNIDCIEYTIKKQSYYLMESPYSNKDYFPTNKEIRDGEDNYDEFINKVNLLSNTLPSFHFWSKYYVPRNDSMLL